MMKERRFCLGRPEVYAVKARATKSDKLHAFLPGSCEELGLRALGFRDSGLRLSVGVSGIRFGMKACGGLSLRVYLLKG